ncbi:MAG: RNA 2',3'-cyclic phosphodiesterase [Actinomycetota bacterium]|nr:RNA 2',3'-cyclic phosphodiesterase [Actinomycetota bacterium]
MPGERLRLFVAVDVPTEQREALAAALAPRRSRLEGARWTKPENQHVTLKFLGWVDSARLDDVSAALGPVGRSHRAAPLSLTGLGAFPSERRARVLWVGLEDPTGLLPRLATATDEALAPLGFERESRAFSPHLTLARLKRPASVSDLVIEPFDAGTRPFVVNHLALYRSYLNPQGARYEVLEAYPLGRRG